jgi:hypothetical protein
MFSFRSIFAAAVALATFTSAIPVGPDAGSTADGLEGNGLSNKITHHLGGGGAVPRDAAYTTPGDAFTQCQSGVQGIVVKIGERFVKFAHRCWHWPGGLEAIVQVSDFDHGQVTALINEIVELLETLVTELQVAISANLSVDAILTVNGVVCTVEAVAQIVFALLQVRIKHFLCIDFRFLLVVSLSFKSWSSSLSWWSVWMLPSPISSTRSGECSVPLFLLSSHWFCSSFSALLVQIISLLVQLVVGIDVVLADLVAALSVDIKLLQCTQILAILNVS